MPKLSVLSSNTSQFWALPRCQRLGWTTLHLVCHGTSDKSLGSHPKSPDVPLGGDKKKTSSICTPSFLTLKSMKTAANLISHTGNTCLARAISDKHMWRWCLDSIVRNIWTQIQFMKISDSFNILQIVKQWLAFLCCGVALSLSFKEKKRQGGMD